MHSFITQALDRLIIELARRSVGREAGLSPRAETARQLLERPDFFDAGASSPPVLHFTDPQRFTFATSATSTIPPNDVVHGKLFRTENPLAGESAVVLIHGWNAEWCYRALFPRLARRLVSAGIHVVTIELPHHGNRKSRGPGGARNFICEDLARMVESTRQAIADIRAIVHWLSSEGCAAIGLWGFSLGGWLAGLTACHEPGVDAAVLATPIVDLRRAIHELPFCRPIQRSLTDNPVTLDRLSLLSHSPADHQRILLLESTYDLFAPRETIEDLWRAWKQAEIWRLPHGHISIWFSRAIMNRTATWLAHQLK